MRANAQNKENIDPKTPISAPVMQADTTASVDAQNPDDFVEINLDSDNGQIDETPNANLNSSTTKEADEKARERNKKVDEEGTDADEDEMEGLGSTDSSSDLGDIDLDDLLEIEKVIPDDLDTPNFPNRPCTPFENHPSKTQASPLSQINPPSLDSKDLPAPLKVNKSSYFSKDNPMRTMTLFEEREEADNWFDEGEIDDDGIRRDEVELSFAEWHLNRHPTLGKYRVKDISPLRICETIETETPSEAT